jgi:hypothetical protein
MLRDTPDPAGSSRDRAQTDTRQGIRFCWMRFFRASGTLQNSGMRFLMTRLCQIGEMPFSNPQTCHSSSGDTQGICLKALWISASDSQDKMGGWSRLATWRQTSFSLGIPAFCRLRRPGGRGPAGIGGAGSRRVSAWLGRAGTRLGLGRARAGHSLTPPA